MTPSRTQGPAAEREGTSAVIAGDPDSGAGTVVLTVNGDRRTLADGATIADLLRELDLDPRMIVVEHNGEILRRDAAAPVHTLRTGDIVELVHFVGGG
jgi:thiamine biosynthesis protein ThiS